MKKKKINNFQIPRLTFPKIKAENQGQVLIADGTGNISFDEAGKFDSSKILDYSNLMNKWYASSRWNQPKISHEQYEAEQNELAEEYGEQE